MACCNPFNAKLNPISHLLTLLGAHHILHVSRIRVKRHITADDPQFLLSFLSSARYFTNAIRKLSHYDGTPVFGTTTQVNCFRQPRQYINHEAEWYNKFLIK